MSVGQWIERTNAIGIFVKEGRYGGTYAHKDIAFHFVERFTALKGELVAQLKEEANLNKVIQDAAIYP